jgi:hypothetical protein
MSARKCPDCMNTIKTCRELGGCRPKPERVEAYGVKGLASKPWRRTFASAMALSTWAEKNSAEVHGQRFVEAGDAPISHEMIAAKARQRQLIANIKARKAARQERLHAELVETRYGTPQPQIKLSGDRGENQRAISAELHQLAAAVELATMKTTDTWNVELVQDHDTIGRVQLHLVEGDAAEAERGMALLTKIVRDAHLAQAKAVRS